MEADAKNFKDLQGKARDELDIFQSRLQLDPVRLPLFKMS